jgi:prepilin-type N-terminal cleavage/methylation domain-containing protein
MIFLRGMDVERAGFTLIELAVAFVIIAILAAILTPLALDYVNQGRMVRAQADLTTIANAIRFYRKDTGYYPVFDTAAAARVSQGYACILASQAGNNPSDSTGKWFDGSWCTFLPSINVGTTSLETYLNSNFANFSTSARFGNQAFRGPYILEADSDPWGNRYFLTADHLINDDPGWIPFLISAGPNATLETERNQLSTGSFLTGGDDIVVVIH